MGVGGTQAARRVRRRKSDQGLLAKALAGVEIRPLDAALGRAAGELLAIAKRRDVIDAAVALLAKDGDCIVTSDPEDIEPLVVALSRHVELIPT